MVVILVLVPVNTYIQIGKQYQSTKQLLHVHVVLHTAPLI